MEVIGTIISENLALSPGEVSDSKFMLKREDDSEVSFTVSSSSCVNSQFLTKGRYVVDSGLLFHPHSVFYFHPYSGKVSPHLEWVNRQE